MLEIPGTSFFSLVTSTDIVFRSAVDFYTTLGFTALRTFNSEDIFSTGVYDSANALDTIKETWLHLFDGPDSSPVTIKVRLLANLDVASKLPEDEKASKHKQIVFQTNDISKIKQVLEEKLQTKYTTIDDANISVCDPTGLSIGFVQNKPPAAPETSKTDALESNSNETTDSNTDKHVNMTSFNRHATSLSSFKRKKIAILTSGGDSQGMSACVRAVVRTAIHYGCDAFAVYEGYEGLVRGGSEYIRKMAWEDVRGWLSEGGTKIGTARCAAFREREGRLTAAMNLVTEGIDALVVCGGDGSLTGADRFRQEWPSLMEELLKTRRITSEQLKGHEHLTIVGTVGSIDNDMALTDSTIGAYSSLDRIIEMVDYIDSTAMSHSRAFVVEVMGRHCGWLALLAGIATEADYAFLPERAKSPLVWEKELLEICEHHRKQGKRKTVVIVAEGAIDNELKPITPEIVKDLLVEKLGLDTRITTLGHVQRGGTAVAFDRILATMQGVDAVRCILESTPATPSYIIGVKENNVCRFPLMESVQITQSVAEAIKNHDFDLAMSLRDSEFSDHYENFQILTLGDVETKKAERPLNLAIINVGAPAGGMNAATRSAALYCLNRGHRAFTINNGFSGLVKHQSVTEVKWLDLDGWTMKGGSEIGTNRSLPEIDLGQIAYNFQKHQFDGLLIIGGFEAFRSLKQLKDAREFYPAFRIPMVCLPATVSNNVPGTEYSIGTDTCLNMLVNYTDAVKQSASATRRRVFVVEVQGGQSGFIASYAGLITGALAVWTPEHPMTLHSLSEDMEVLVDNYAQDQGENRGGKILIRNEKCSQVYTTELITDIITEYGKGKFEAREAIPGHLQQGDRPSSIDRVRAVRLAIKCVKFIEESYDNFSSSNSSFSESAFESENDSYDTRSINLDDAAVVVGIEKGKLSFTDVDHLWENETELELRRPKTRHHELIHEVSEMLSGRLRLLGKRTSLF
ncbi:6-phosphofructokinase [Nadsonia fulvescens var. elongata DSM 6958]|uniref:ATP-dependent 6-phosphofructokinase n=1 Tax=Nadsonia fulvescens var. elongata DSM 6958 TaxID=857566 RepID=A0A1E3PPA8_9ASCO|nr:6-phosphofructokinase [Nadsonia fulvescens var. elongata DSM 6958]